MTFSVGWEEWVALPDLRIPAIRAKVDTGAQTSSIHAFSIHPFEEDGNSRVRFGLHPVPERPDIELYCVADLVGQRAITSSNGETELRYIITSHISVGGRTWPIELSLANRETMAYRMLLGRRALEAGVLVDVTRSMIHGSPDLGIYDSLPHARAADRALHLAILFSDDNRAFAERMQEAAQARGHKVQSLFAERCYVAFGDNGPALLQKGEPVPRFDAVVPCLGPQDKGHGLAVLRQFEAEGVRSLNSSAALAAVWDRIVLCQHLARRGVRQPLTGFAGTLQDAPYLIDRMGEPPFALKLSGSPDSPSVVLADDKRAVVTALKTFHRLNAQTVVQRYVAKAGGRVLRCLMAGRRLVAAIGSAPGTGADERSLVRVRPTRDDRRLASRAMTALNLQMGVVDLVRSDEGPMVVDMDPVFAFDMFEGISGVDAAAELIAHLEQRAGRKTGL